MSAEPEKPIRDPQWQVRQMCLFIGSVKAVVHLVALGMETPESAIAQIQYGVDKLYSDIGWENLK